MAISNVYNTLLERMATVPCPHVTRAATLDVSLPTRGARIPSRPSLQEFRLHALVEEEVPVVGVVAELLRRAEVGLHQRLVHDLHVLVVEEEPVVVALDKADVVPVVGATAGGGVQERTGR